MQYVLENNYTTFTTARAFVGMAGAFLAVSALLKLIDSFSGKGYLQIDDPVFPFVSAATTALIAVAIEGSLFILSIARIPVDLKLVGIMWFSVCLGLYKIIASINLPGKPCPCFGSLLSEVLSPRVVDAVSWGYIIASSVLAGLLLWRRTRRDTTA